jgi:DNA-binding transcriptional MocR family regulator
VDDQQASLRLRQHGVMAAPLSVHYLGTPPTRRGLVLGFGGFEEREVADAIARMASLMRDFPPVAARAKRSLMCW